MKFSIEACELSRAASWLLITRFNSGGRTAMLKPRSRCSGQVHATLHNQHTLSMRYEKRNDLSFFCLVGGLFEDHGCCGGG